MPLTPLDRVIDYANARGWSVRWAKEKPGLWRVTIQRDSGDLDGYGPSLQEAATSLIRDRLASVEREAEKLRT